MTIKKTLCALVAATSIGLGTLTFTCCDNSAYQERVRQEQVLAQKQFESLYSDAQIIARYSVPFVEIKSKKTSYTLDPFTHMGNEMKAQTIRLPVSESYFSSVSVGQELQSKFNTGGLILRGELEGYSLNISDKHRNDVCYVRNAEGWKEITPQQYEQLVALNSQRNELSTEGGIMTRSDVSEQIRDEAKKTCKIVVESKKSNITLDIFQHLENEWNKMRYPIEIPKFLGDRLQVGSEIDQNFVGGSLFFSRSPSIVKYRVLEKNCQ